MPAVGGEVFVSTVTELPTTAVCGLTFRQLFVDDSGRDTEVARLSGPLLSAGLGVRLAGENPYLLGAVSASLSSDEFALFNTFRSGLNGVKVLQKEPLVLRTPRLLNGSVRYKILGDPALWRGSAQLPEGVNRLVLANADPAWYAQIVATLRNEIQIFVDLHSQWLPFRPSETLTCLRAASVVTLTEAEYQILPKHLLLKSRLGAQGGPALLIKRGSRGCFLRANDQDIEMSAPELAHAPSHDVGAGDLLIGLLAGHCPMTRTVDLEDLQRAYLRSMPTLSEFLNCNDPVTFIHRNLGVEPGTM